MNKVGSGKMNKTELVDLAIAKVKKLKISELKEFIGINKPIVKIPETFSIDVSYVVNSYNNTSQGRNSGGGALYKRATVTIKNQEFNNRELSITVKWFVPSGYGDGDMFTEPAQYILSDKDLLGMQEHGVRDFLKALFQIPYTLQWNKQIPYSFPTRK